MRVLVHGLPEEIPSGLWCYRVDGSRSLLGGAVNDVGRVVSWLQSTVRLPEDDFNLILAAAPQASTPLVLPYFSGERSTGWAANARAVFTGVSAATTGAMLFRGAMEGVAISYARIAEQLQSVAGQPQRILASGRVTQDLPAGLQILADVLEAPVIPVTIKRSTLRGTALIALDVLAPEVARTASATGEIRQCDMILFFRNHDEDFGFVRDAVRSGEITPDRLNDALTRILGLKAKLGLHLRAKDDLVPAIDELAVIGCAEHHEIAARIADRTIALLKDTAETLPLDPVRHRRVRLYCLESAPDFTGMTPEFKRVAIEELTAAGFEVSVYKTVQELAAEGQQPDMQTFIADETEGYTDKYDAALILANVSDFAQQGALRIKWSMPMGPEMPWYAAEVPRSSSRSTCPTT